MLDGKLKAEEDPAKKEMLTKMVNRVNEAIDHIEKTMNNKETDEAKFKESKQVQIFLFLIDDFFLQTCQLLSFWSVAHLISLSFLQK